MSNYKTGSWSRRRGCGCCRATVTRSPVSASGGGAWSAEAGTAASSSGRPSQTGGCSGRGNILEKIQYKNRRCEHKFYIPSMLTNFCYFILKTPFLDPSAFRLTAKYSLLLLGCSGVTRSCSTLLRRTRTGVSDFLEVIIDS